MQSHERYASWAMRQYCKPNRTIQYKRVRFLLPQRLASKQSRKTPEHLAGISRAKIQQCHRLDGYKVSLYKSKLAQRRRAVGMNENTGINYCATSMCGQAISASSNTAIAAGGTPTMRCRAFNCGSTSFSAIQPSIPIAELLEQRNSRRQGRAGSVATIVAKPRSPQSVWLMSILDSVGGKNSASTARPSSPTPGLLLISRLRRKSSRLRLSNAAFGPDHSCKDQ